MGHPAIPKKFNNKGSVSKFPFYLKLNRICYIVYNSDTLIVLMKTRYKQYLFIIHPRVFNKNDNFDIDNKLNVKKMHNALLRQNIALIFNGRFEFDAISDLSAMESAICI